MVGGQEGWHSFKCNPTTNPSACPKTARIHLEGLEQTRGKDAGVLRITCSANEKQKACSTSNQSAGLARGSL